MLKERERSFLRGLPRNRAETTSRVNAGDCHVIFGILPNVRITRNHRGAHSSECVRSCTTRLKGSLTKMPRKNGDHSAEALSKNSHQLGCLFQDKEPPGSSSILRKATQVLKSIRKVKFAENTRRHIKIREKGSTLVVIQPTKPHERCPYAPKVEDWSRERDRNARAMRPRRCVETGQKDPKTEEEDNAAFFSPTETWCIPVPSFTYPEGENLWKILEHQCTCGARKTSHSAELETVHVFKNPVTVITAKGEVQTK